MNSQKPRTSLPLILVALAVSTTHSLGIDPMAAMSHALTSEQDRKKKNIPGPSAADEMFTRADWRNDMATQIAIAIEKSRYTGPLRKKEAEWLKLNERDPDNQKPATMAAYMAFQDEDAKFRQSDPYRKKVNTMFRLLGWLSDPRIVPLIAPALMENSTGHPSEAETPPPQRAAEVLRDLAIRKVITITDPKPVYDSAGWRSWWKENRANFDQVPEPLRAIDEGRITKTRDPATTFMTPVEKPSPEQIAEWEAEIKAARAKEEAEKSAAIR